MKSNDAGEVVPVQRGKDVSAGIMDVPVEALDSIEEDSITAGGEWQVPEEYEGSIGTTMFDMPNSKDGTVTVLLQQSNIDLLSLQALVRIKSKGDSRVYLGAVVEGPFAEPDGLRAWFIRGPRRPSPRPARFPSARSNGCSPGCSRPGWSRSTGRPTPRRSRRASIGSPSTSCTICR